MSWKQELSESIHQRWRPGQSFSLAEVYALEDRLRTMHPENAHVRDKIRQTLQYLRDEGEVSFIDGQGRYLLLR